jgi:Uncharacterized conserved protein
MRTLVAAIAMLAATSGIAFAAGKSEQSLALEGKIPLGEVAGRIDHLAIDARHQRMFVAELGNDSVAVVDLAERRVVRTLTGIPGPQGIAYDQASDTLFVAAGGDGSLRLFRGIPLAPDGRVEVGTDVDNVRIDPNRREVYAGSGDGELTVIDAASHRVKARVALAAHPESFQIEESGSRVFINVPEARSIAVVDRLAGRQTAAWSTHELAANFPMAIDGVRRYLLVGFRTPAALVAVDIADGARVSTTAACGDADDIHLDVRRRRVYMSCGEGFVDVFAADARDYPRVARIRTLKGARTSLFSAELDRLFLAARAYAGEPAAIWVFRPTP